MNITVGYIFLKEQGHEQIKVPQRLLWESLFCSLGSLKRDGSLRESKQLVEPVVKAELGPEEAAEGQGQGSRWHEPKRTNPKKCEVAGLMTEILV